MARRKKPALETEQEIKNRHLLEKISNFSTRSEKVSWNRKMDNMVKLMTQLKGIEDDILETINNKKNPLLDEIAQLRVLMVQDCVHPYEQLVIHDNHIVCKFCNKKMAITNKEQ